MTGENKGRITLRSRPLYVEGAHQLKFLPPEHKCSRLHGHSWAIQVDVRSKGINGSRPAFIVDYAVLNGALHEHVHKTIDHRFFNDVAGLECPTTETIAAWVAERMIAALPDVLIARVYVKEGFDGGEALWETDEE